MFFGDKRKGVDENIGIIEHQKNWRTRSILVKFACGSGVVGSG